MVVAVQIGRGVGVMMVSSIAVNDVVTKRTRQMMHSSIRCNISYQTDVVIIFAFVNVQEVDTARAAAGPCCS
jgi:hypothetical protein